MSLAEEFIRDVLKHAEALRAAGVLRLGVEGCSVELAPYQPEPDQVDEEEEREDPEHPAFNPKIKLREYHAKGSSQ